MICPAWIGRLKSVAFNTYSGLKTTLESWLARSDITTELDDFIDLAEERLSRDLRIRATEATFNITISGGVAPIPADYVQLKHVFIAGSPTQPLEPKESTWIFDQFPTRSSDSKPHYIAEDGANFVFGPFPDSSTYVLGGAYWKKPTALSDSNTTNEWTDNCPDALLWASLCESAPFLMNDERLIVWETKYEAARIRIMKAEKKRARKGTRISIDPGIVGARGA
jgi:hypothetical protein